MHKDLDEVMRWGVEFDAKLLVSRLHYQGQSLAIAREALINAFDRAAEELEGDDGQA